MMIQRNTHKLENIIYVYIILISLPFILNKILGIENLAIFNIGIFLLFFIVIILNIRKIKLKVVIFSIALFLSHEISLIYSIERIDINNYIYESIYYLSSSIFIIIIYNLNENIINFKLLINKIVTSTILVGWIYCTYNLVTNIENIFNIYLITDAYAVNFSSFFNNRNGFGFLLVICIYANAIYYIHSSKKKEKIFSIITFIMFFINCVLTLSRTAILSSAIFLLIFYILDGEKEKVKNILIGLIISIIFVILIISIEKTPIYSFIENIIIRKETGVTSRDLAWELGIDILKNNFITGIGISNAENIVSNILGNGNYHNTYIQLLVVGGIINFMIYILIITNALRLSKIVYKHNKKQGSVLLSIIISMLIYFIFETINILSFGLQGSLVTIYIIMLPQIYYINIKQKEKYSEYKIS